MKLWIIKLNLIVTIQNELTDDKAVETQKKILNRIEETEAKGLLIDLSVIDVVDSFLGRVLNDTAMMARCLNYKYFRKRGNMDTENI